MERLAFVTNALELFSPKALLLSVEQISTFEGKKKKPSFAEQVLNYCLKSCCLPFTALQAVQKPEMPPPRSVASLGSKKSQTAQVLGQRGSCLRTDAVHHHRAEVVWLLWTALGKALGWDHRPHRSTSPLQPAS